MPDWKQITDDSRLPNSNELEGYDVYDVFESQTRPRKVGSPDIELRLELGGRLMGTLDLGRNGSGLFRFGLAKYGVSYQVTSSSCGDTFYLEVFDLEFERLLGRAMAHGMVSLVHIIGLEVEQSVLLTEGPCVNLMRGRTSVTKTPVIGNGERDESAICQIYVRKDVEEPDLLVLNSLLLSDQEAWHSITARVSSS
ncbi:MAG: hypothetical protein JST12_09275 [Armatimonadetes bacterium]|nr:hypothetical protein [Armatimonadota bacterium]